MRERLWIRVALVAIFVALLGVGLLFQLRVLEVPPEVGATIHRVGNIIEAGIWLVAASFVFWKSRRSCRAVRWIGRLAAAAYVAFGVSDLVETRTGAWYEPWWLFVWKAACVVCLLACLVLYLRKRPGRHGDTPETH